MLKYTPFTKALIVFAVTGLLHIGLFTIARQYLDEECGWSGLGMLACQPGMGIKGAFALYAIAFVCVPVLTALALGSLGFKHHWQAALLPQVVAIPVMLLLFQPLIRSGESGAVWAWDAATQLMAVPLVGLVLAARSPADAGEH